MNDDQGLKPLDFVGSSRDDLREFPDAVKQEIGYALFEAQKGERPVSAKPLKGFGSAGVLEILEDHRGDAYRAVCTVKFAEVIYVLHCFQKKAKRGIKTPMRDLNLIRQRLGTAEEDHKIYYARG